MSNGTEKIEYVSYLDYQGKYKGIMAWIMATDHKRICLLYMYSIMTFFFIGVVLGILMKVELSIFKFSDV